MFVKVSAFVAVILGLAFALPTQGKTEVVSSSQGSPTCYSGKLEVRSTFDGGNRIGYIRNWEGGDIAGLDSDRPLEVKVCEAGSGLYNIIATNPNFPPPHYVGAGTWAGTFTNAGFLRTGDRNAVGFRTVPQTPPNVPPTLTNGEYYESAIWSYKLSTKQLTPQWINPDGSKPATVIAYDARANGIFFTGDISQWNTPGSFASAVLFYLG